MYKDISIVPSFDGFTNQFPHGTVGSASLLPPPAEQERLAIGSCTSISGFWVQPTTKHGSLNVPIEHHPTIRNMVYNGYYKVMSNIPKMGHLPTPAKALPSHD